jgi:hypothetical protein
MLLLVLAVPVLAKEYAKVDKKGKVTAVIVADDKAIKARKDGPWILARRKVSIGWTYKGGQFVAPVTSTYTVHFSTR